MIQKAIFIYHLKDLHMIRDYQRVYFGHEFCQNLILSVNEIKAWLAKMQDKDFTFVTPYLTQEGLKKVKLTLTLLNKNYRGAEVVFNDFGVLNLINKRFHNLVPVMGRVLSHNLFPLEKIIRLKDKKMLTYFNKFKVNRFELDCRGKNANFDLNDFSGDMNISLHYPYLYISTTRRCVTAALGKKGKNNLSIFQCNKECLSPKIQFILKNPVIKNNLYMKGNTYYIKYNKLPKNLSKTVITRLVYNNPFD